LRAEHRSAAIERAARRRPIGSPRLVGVYGCIPKKSDGSGNTGEKQPTKIKMDPMQPLRRVRTDERRVWRSPVLKVVPGAI
jgi:hypothetical protein